MNLDGLFKIPRKTKLIFLALAVDLAVIAGGIAMGLAFFAPAPALVPVFSEAVPEGEDSTWACYLEAGSKRLDCNDYMKVTVSILQRNRCTCAGQQQPDEGDDE